MAATERSRAEKVAWVWQLHAVERQTIREIAAATGLSVGSVHNYLKEARAAEVHVQLLDVAEQRDLMAVQLDAINAALFAEYQQGTKMSQIAPILLQIMTRRARLLGLDAPTRVAVEDDGSSQSPVDPEVLAAVREVQRQNLVDRRELGAPVRGEVAS